MKIKTIFLNLVVLIIGSQSLISQEGYIPANNAKIFYKCIGHGEPILVLHGGPGLDHTYLLPQFEELAKKYTVIFYDQRGSGNSTGTIDSISITPRQFVDDLEALRTELKIKQINLLGHSWGGMLAMEYAMQFPNNVKTLILMNTIGATSDYAIPFYANREKRRTSADSSDIVRVISSADVANGDTIAMRKLAHLFFKSYFHDQSLSDRLNMNFSDATAHHLFPVLTLMMSHYAQYDFTSKLKKIQFPVLVLHGDDDPIPYVYAQHISQQISGSQFVLLKDCGHFPYIEKPKELFSAVTDFLKKSAR